MAGEKLLSEFACKGAKARESIYYINDGAGLRLRTRPSRRSNSQILFAREGITIPIIRAVGGHN